MLGSNKSLLFACTFAAVGLAAPLAQASIVNADIGKNLEYQQTGPGTVVAFNGGTNAFLFGRVFYPNPADFDGGQMTFAGPASPADFNVSGLLDCCGNYGAGYQTGYLTQADMDLNFPTGITYSLTATNSSTSTSQTVDIDFANDLYASVIPALDPASFTALQSSAAPSGLTVSFNSFTPNPLADFGQGFFTIWDDTVGGAVVANFAGLPSSATSVFLAPGTLTRGHQYTFELIFDDGVNAVDPNGVFTTARSDVRTLGIFTVSSAPEPAAWALMLIGFGALGAALRRARRASGALAA